jgi:ElaB/YqjD/DUF883 family membrane-anchored ribosome-binding protein
MYGEKAMAATKKMASEASDAELNEDLAALRKDLAALRDDVLALTAKSAVNAGEAVEDNIARVRARAEDFISSADKETRAAMSSVEKNVRDNPVASLGAAAAVGFLLGRAFLRK